MDRRAALKALGAIAASSSIESSVLAQGMKPVRPPNVVLVVVDDLRFDEFGAGGHSYVQTPNIDRLAREGVTFTRMFHATPLCSPNRASILTGEYAARHAVYNNVSRSKASYSLRTMARHLQAAGYETAHVGKWHMGDDPRPRPGYDYWVSFPGQGKIINPEFWEDGRLHEVQGYITDLLTDRAAAFLRARNRSKPFFLYLGHKAIHPDVQQRNDASLDLTGGVHYVAAPRHAGRYAGANFKRAPSASGPIPNRPKSKMIDHILALQAAEPVQKAYGSMMDPGTSEQTIRERAEMLLSVDDSVGTLLDLLSREGDLDNTVVIFTSDNGFFFGEHGLSVERRLPYEESIRMPVLLRYPPLAKAGAKVPELGSSTDIAPTILDIAGLGVPDHMQGRSLKVALDGIHTAHGRQGILTEYYSDDEPMPWLLDADYKSIRTERYKYVHWLQYPQFDELYDLEADPYEMRNLYGTNHALETRLRRELSHLVDAAQGLDDHRL